jgi:hypothetical protein
MTSGSRTSLGRAAASASFVTPWRTIALVSLGVATAGISATLTALVVVATRHEAGGLETVALELAVLAFIIQIIVFVAQVFAVNQQTARGEEIYARMTGLLEGLRGTTQGTQETLQRYMGVLLRAATGAASEAVADAGPEEKFNPVEFERRVLQRAGEVARSEGERLPGLDLESAALSRPHTPSRDDQRKIDLLTSFPTEDEGREAYDMLLQLSPMAISVLQDFANDELDSLRGGFAPGLRKLPSAVVTSELTNGGFTEQVGEPSADGTRMTVLTPLGRDVARFLTARPAAVPEWLRRRLTE